MVCALVAARARFRTHEAMSAVLRDVAAVSSGAHKFVAEQLRANRSRSNRVHSVRRDESAEEEAIAAHAIALEAAARSRSLVRVALDALQGAAPSLITGSRAVRVGGDVADCTVSTIARRTPCCASCSAPTTLRC